jgi:hypothetical protein
MVDLRRLPPTAVLALLLVGPVAGAEKPQLLPTQDVDVTYDVTLPSQPRIRERVRWLAAEQLERVDGAFPASFACCAHLGHETSVSANLE